MRKDRNLLAAFLLLLVLTSLPWWALKNSYTMGIVINALAFVSLGLAWNIISGFGGQLSMGHAAFYGLGGYTSALLLTRMGISPWIGMVPGMAVAVFAGLILGYPSFRLSGVYFKLVTFTFGLILEIVARSWINLTEGDPGVKIPLLGNAPAMFQFDSAWPYYYIILGLAALYFLISRWVLRSRFGFYLQALRDDQVAAETLGINSLRMKLTGFALSAAMAALVGTFVTQYLLFIDPSSGFGMFTSVKIALVAIVGGTGALWGPVIGGLFLIPLAELANAQFSNITGVDVVLYSAVLILTAMFLPRGLVSIPDLVRVRKAPQTVPEEQPLPEQKSRLSGELGLTEANPKAE
jgi:branched-chain amino acid transport system permease protein